MSSKQATIVAGLGFGDEGKGTMVDYFARRGKVSAVVRFNGGPQARHSVMTSDGRQHTFSQFGSGSFVPGVRTHLSHFMLVDPLEMVAEAHILHRLYCRRAYELLSVDERAMIITPFHKAANRIRERVRGKNAHGSCGMGIGETMHMSLTQPDLIVRAKDLKDVGVLRKKLRRIQEHLRSEFAGTEGLEGITHPSDEWENALSDAGALLRIVPGDHLTHLARAGDLVFEGAQGVLLDEWHGFHPHTTWSTTTFANAETLLREIGYEGRVEKVGVLRAYHTRHGEGPFVTEDASLTEMFPDPHNDDLGPQGTFRVGWFDLVLARYALAVSGGADSLVITNLDRFESVVDRKICTAYRMPQGTMIDRFVPKSVLTDLSYQEALTRLLNSVRPHYENASGNNEEYLRMIERELNVPITITSAGPTAADKRIRAKASIAA